MDIQQQVIQTYQSNLAYLQKHHPNLYKRVIAFDKALGNGECEEVYTLEYKNEGYFDALNHKSNTYLYGMDSNEYSQSITDVITLDKKGSMFEGQRYISYDLEKLEELDSKPLEFKNGYWGAFKPLYYNFQHASKEKTSFKKVPKVLFLDLRLGLHLKPIISKLHANHVFIHEKSLEVFRLSLFITPYYDIFKLCTLYFNIHENEKNTKQNFMLFVKKEHHFNLYMKHITLTQEYFEELQKFQIFIFDQDYIHYPHANLLLNYINAPYHMKYNYTYLNVSRRYSDTIFSKKPLLLLFSGPSTLKNINDILKLKDKFTIVSPLSTCKLLYKYDIKPDIVIHIDPQDENSMILVDGINKEFFQSSLFIFSSVIHKNVTAYFSKENIFVVPNMEGFKKDFHALSSPTVGEFTYALMLLLGVQNMYLLGIDMALNANTLQTHNEYHFASMKGSSATDIVTERIHYVEGNFRQLVPTLAGYMPSIEHFKLFFPMKDTSQNIYNLSDGAKLEGCTPLNIKDIDITLFPNLDKKELHVKIKDFLLSIGSSEFRDVDKDLIRYQITRAAYLLSIVKKHQNNTYKDEDLYFSSILKLSEKLTKDKREDHLLSKVYRFYFKIILSYIFDLFNTKELTDTKNHIKNIDLILTEQLQRIGRTFIDKLQEYLK
ncbi:MAG: motility associated factor glycosyltransferase family protein [Campylobacterales bacterium]|nr:motility associated factor glycosyltransferase family protein [Campylobacterales bacterium]